MKEKIFNHCIKTIEKQIENFRNAVNTAQHSANEEGKSSMGDKYETGRSMMQLEIEKNAIQLDQSLKELEYVKKLKEVHNKEFIVQGSLVTTNLGVYYLATGIGVVKLDEQTFYVVSQDSPIGLILKGKKIGDSFSFNERKFNIENID